MKFLQMVGVLSCMAPLLAFGQLQISGTVNDEQGQPLIGAHIRILNSYKGTFTRSNGTYKFTNLKSGTYTLIVSYIGFQTQEKELVIQGEDVQADFKMKREVFLSEEIVVQATRASKKTPFATTAVERDEIASKNLGLDMPLVLEYAPSVVTTSDAGAGIGYTGMRIRGSDATRINVTINGIPLNDAESQNVFWVDLPDFATSVDNIQMQRGVGTSTNGAGAFGATINLQTVNFRKEPYAEVSNSVGSFATRRHTVNFGSGLLNDRFVFEGRLSRIASEGYIDRATSDLRSYFFSAGWLGEKSILKFNIFSGKEITYQAWGGVPSDSLEANRTFNPYTYENEVDDYLQTHYQLHYANQWNSKLKFNGALHYTDGNGFFEQFREDDPFSSYNLDDVILGGDTILSTDLIRRRWLDNDFYGAVYSFHYTDGKKVNAVLGGGAHRYLGRHFGEVIWAQFASNGDIRHLYYDNDAEKMDVNVYGKVNYYLTDRFNLLADLQWRGVSYDFLGFDANGVNIRQTANLSFFNPKFGVTYDLTSTNYLYASYAVGNREPNRDDYTESSPQSRPVHETLYDLEIGYKGATKKIAYHINFYNMQYENQLVLTGEVNDVGAYTRTNVEDSYRRGVEVITTLSLMKNLKWNANLTLSENKINSFTAFVDNFDTFGQEQIDYENTDLAFSPNTIAGSELLFDLVTLDNATPKSYGVEIAWLSKYVGKQFIDNTASDSRSLDPYWVNDLRLTYRLQTSWLKGLRLTALMRNFLDEEYETNAWVYRFVSGDEFQQADGYFPQAGRHYLIGLALQF